MQANINSSTPIVDSPEIIAGALTPVDSKALKDILNVAEVAEILRCSRNHVSNVLNGRVPGVPVMPHFTMGRRKLVRREWLIEWLQSYRTRC